MKQLEMHNGTVQDSDDCDHDWQPVYTPGTTDRIGVVCKACRRYTPD